MTDEQKRIIEKVKKMLALSENNSSAEEAETAITMARQLLSKYNLSIKDIDEYKEKAECTERGCRIRTKVIPQWVNALMSLCQYTYDTTSLLYTNKGERPTIMFVGVEPNTTICLNTFVMLYKALDEMTLVEHPGFYVADRKTSWRMGFINGLYNKIRAQKASIVPEERGLVVIQKNKIDDYLRSQYEGRIKERKAPKMRNSTDGQAYAEGYARGQDYNINPQLEEAHGF